MEGRELTPRAAARRGAALAALVLVGLPSASFGDPGNSPGSAPSGLARWFDPSTAPFIPIPEVDVSPHSGLTLGVIPTTLSTNDQGELSRIVAPDLIHSEYFGWGTRGRVFDYPSPDAQWSLVGGLKQRVEREFDGRYESGLAHDRDYSWSVEAIYDRSGVPRFFGVGNGSAKADESTYVGNQGRVDVVIGRNLSPALQVAYVARLRVIEVLPGVLPGLPSIETRFPHVPGLGTEREVGQRLLVTYDTRDSATVAHSGGRMLLYGGFASRSLGSTFADSAFGVDGRRYWRLDDGATLAGHASLRVMPSARGAPFWALSSLGGDRSTPDECEPLRGYGEGRFVDRNVAAAGIELRTRAWDGDAFATRLSVEVAPFVDVGKVYGGGEGVATRLHHVAGLGVRGVAAPFVVGYVDVGYGNEGAAVFSGINYPF